MGAREQVPMDGLQCRRSSPNIWAAGGALSFLSKVMYGGCQKYDVASLSPCSAFTGIPLSSIICGGLRPSRLQMEPKGGLLRQAALQTREVGTECLALCVPLPGPSGCYSQGLLEREPSIGCLSPCAASSLVLSTEGVAGR